MTVFWVNCPFKIPQRFLSSYLGL